LIIVEYKWECFTPEKCLNYFSVHHSEILCCKVSQLESQIAKLRAAVEKGEASRANIEFELTRSKRDLAQCKHNAAGRESSLEEANAELKSMSYVMCTKVLYE